MLTISATLNFWAGALILSELIFTDDYQLLFSYMSQKKASRIQLTYGIDGNRDERMIRFEGKKKKRTCLIRDFLKRAEKRKMRGSLSNARLTRRGSASVLVLPQGSAGSRTATIGSPRHFESHQDLNYRRDLVILKVSGSFDRWHYYMYVHVVTEAEKMGYCPANVVEIEPVSLPLPFLFFCSETYRVATNDRGRASVPRVKT